MAFSLSAIHSLAQAQQLLVLINVLCIRLGGNYRKGQKVVKENGRVMVIGRKLIQEDSIVEHLRGSHF